MARPKSEDKRNAILTAATQVIAQEGLSAPTAKIAKLAGVAEGTLFTYFNSKDELLNLLYLELKSELKEVVMSSYPKTKSVRSRIRHAWQDYVSWGVAHPHKRKVLAQLDVSDKITERSKAAGMLAFAELNTLVHESIAAGALREHSPVFVSAIMASLAETTMDFMARDASKADEYSESGFEAFWNAIAKK
jgi:AcrR family transcriptional regulator